MAENDSAVWFDLEPDCGESISFAAFLEKAAKDESLFDSVWQRAKRKTIAGGYFSPAGDDDQEPDQYLLGLASEGIRSYKAFAGIEGNEYVVAELTGNEPIERMLVLIGPPGSGKTFILDRWLGFVSGEVFHMIDGCPNNCRPESLLTLLTEEQVRKLPSQFGNAEALLALRSSKKTIKPCDHCQEKIFGPRDEPSRKPRLDEIKIQPVKLLVRNGHGAAFWTPSESSVSTPLETALKQGSHLCVLAQPFARTSWSSDKTPAYHVLLEAVQGRHVLSDGTPYGGLVVLETNQEGHDKYLSGVNDKGAYIRRSDYVQVPYLGVVSRERRMYEERVRVLGLDVNYDPLVLDALAALAVSSRLKVSLATNNAGISGVVVPEMSRIERMRIQDGDLTLLELSFRKTAKQKDVQPRYTNGADHNFELAQMRKALRIAAGNDDCFGGLSASFMLEKVVEPLTYAAQLFPEKRVTFLAAVDFLKAAITQQVNDKDSKAGHEQKEMYKDCLGQLELAPLNGTPKLVEKWYRWRLNHLMQLAFFPELDDQLDERFVEYFDVSCALGEGKQTYVDAGGKNQIVTAELIDRALRPAESLIGLTKPEDVSLHRSGLRSRMRMYLLAYCDRLGISAAQAQKQRPTWDTMPEVKRAMCILQGEDNFRKVGVCLDEEELKKQDEKKHIPLKLDEVMSLRQAAMRNLKARGYSDASLQGMLSYYRANFLWRIFNEDGHNAYC
jgi:hypothetical protein